MGGRALLDQTASQKTEPAGCMFVAKNRSPWGTIARRGILLARSAQQLRQRFFSHHFPSHALEEFCLIVSHPSLPGVSMSFSRARFSASAPNTLRSRRRTNSWKKADRLRFVSRGFESLEERVLLTADGLQPASDAVHAKIDDHRTLMIIGTSADDNIQLATSPSTRDTEEQLLIHTDDSEISQFRFDFANFDTIKITTFAGNDTVLLRDPDIHFKNIAFDITVGLGSDIVDLSGQNRSVGVQQDLQPLLQTSDQLRTIAEAIEQASSEWTAEQETGFVESITSQLLDAAQRLSQTAELASPTSETRWTERVQAELHALADRFATEVDAENDSIGKTIEAIHGIAERSHQIREGNNGQIEGADRM